MYDYFQFFVASDPTVKEDKLWHEKYSLRKSMIPSFITKEQANKVSLQYQIDIVLNSCSRQPQKSGMQIHPSFEKSNFTETETQFIHFIHCRLWI